MMSTDAMAVPAPAVESIGLNSPPDSNPTMRDGGSDSELSDLEPDTDSKIPFTVKPAFISDGGVPVFEPTMEELSDFQRFIDAVNPYGMKTGIVKVRPPKEWRDNQPPLDQAIKTVVIKNPIMQDIAGSNGTYRQSNMEKGRSYNLPQWRELCEKSEHQPPAKRGERRVNQAPIAKPVPKAKTQTKTAAPPKRRGRKPAKSKSGTGANTPDRLPTPVSPSMKDDDDDSMQLDDDEPAPFRRMGGMRQPISVSARRKNNQAQAAYIDEAAFEGFKYELDDKFPKERCDELERQYWKTLTFAPPLYGGDMPGTLFDERTKMWNLSNLPNLLNVLGQKIPGVNTAYLYLGMWKATFAWHLEDVDLYSINYLHFGAPKQWYSISQGDARKFERAMASIWPIDAKKCDQFLRHKTYLISPSTLLSQYGIKVNKIVHHPGEFVITFPYGYHSGYNLGYNCAEAVNFAVESWLEHARVAKRCECSDAEDSVWVDYKEIERKLRGEETDYEETDDDEDEDEDVEDDTLGLPSPPQSHGEAKTKAPPRKRKRPTTDKGNMANAKKIRLRVKAPTKEPCILCPNDIPSEPLLETDKGQKVHRICAQYIPETRIESGEKDIVMDLEHIPKARHDLKCNFCRSKKGACFQCSQKKCARAYHGTCAAAAGVFVEQGEVPHFGEDGTEYKKSDFGFSCRFHRTKRDKKLDADALGDDQRILKAASMLKVGEICQLQYYRGDIFAGAIVENRRSEETLLVDIVPRGERIEVEYKWLLLPDASDYHLPKASASAIEMPKAFKDRALLNTTDRQADDLPRAEDPFVEGTTWSEFKCENIPRNSSQVKIDFAKQNQVWYYLGKTSTEAKAQFTEDPAKPVHNPKGHFLDTIPKPVPTIPRQSYAASYPSNHTQNGLNNPRPVIRPPQPAESAFNLSRGEKPYQYKPRASSGELYRVDQQAFNSQHNFVQRSAQGLSQAPAPKAPVSQTPIPKPYGLKFDTDPKYNSAARAASQYPGNSAYSTGSPYSNSAIRPALSTGPLAPPASYRPPVSISVSSRAPSGGSSNSYAKGPFSGRGPFAKYPYLQLEHNRSPLEYKTPYRPGGGFMNGYQGSQESIKAVWREQIFKSSAGRKYETPILPPAKNYGPTTVQKAMNRPAPSPTPSSVPTASGYPSPAVSISSASKGSAPVQPVRSTSSAPNVAAHVPISTTSNNPAYPPAPVSVVRSVQTPWQKKEGSGLHPAIRPEYTLFHNQYQPPPQPPVQAYQTQVMQPPAMYNKQPEASRPYQPLYQNGQFQQTQPEQRGQQPSHGPMGLVSNHVYAQAKSEPVQPSMYRPTSQQAIQPLPNENNEYATQPMYQAHHQYTSGTLQAGQQNFAPQNQQPVNPPYMNIPPNMSQQQAAPATPRTTAMDHASAAYPQYQAPHVNHPEQAAIYAHHQPMQSWNAGPQTLIQQADQPRDFPDLPADSTSIIEKVMMNLRRVPNDPVMPQRHA